MVVLSVLLVIILSAVGFLYVRAARLRHFAETPFGEPGKHVVLIPPGTGPHGMAQLLTAGHVVDNADLLYQLIRETKIAPQLKAGEYEFEGALTPTDVLAKISIGLVKVYRVTIPEGLRIDETLPILAGSELKLDQDKLEALVRDSAFLQKLGINAPSMEGYLYPDTYQFNHGYTEASVLQKMASRAKEEFRRADLHRKPGINLNELRALTLASIVEKETGAVEERPRISCVFHNRLRLGMKLQTDPTVLYAAMLMRGGKFVKNITSKDLVTDHPYNTYMRTGLPPGPIASAGSAAITAALQPIECNDLFFVSRNNGTHVFCPDLKCHEAAVDHWQRQYFKQKH
jgi:UPF0755 protein